MEDFLMLIKHGLGSRIRGLNRVEDFDISINNVLMVASPTVESVTIGDGNYQRSTSATSTFHAEIGGGVIVQNNTPDVISLSDNTAIPLQDRKIAEVVVKQGRVKKKKRFSTVLNSGAVVVDEFVSFRSGSLAKHIKDSFAALNIPTTPTLADVVVNTRDVSTTQGIDRNEVNFFISRFDTSFIGYDVDSTYKHTFVAISPHHVIGARHTFGASKQAPMTLTFYDVNGVKLTRQCVRYINAYPQDIGYDIGIGYLTEALPNTVNPAKILPAGWESKLTKRYTHPATNLPCIVFTNNTSQVGIKEFFFTPSNSNGYMHSARSSVYTDPLWKNDGASSSLIFTIINNELVLLFSYFTRSDDAWTLLDGYCFGSHFTTIQNAMNDISDNYGGWSQIMPHYTLQAADLSGFVSAA